MGLGFMLYSRAGELSSVVMLDSVHVPVRKINFEESLVVYCSLSEYTCICIKRTTFFLRSHPSSDTPLPPPQKKWYAISIGKHSNIHLLRCLILIFTVTIYSLIKYLWVGSIILYKSINEVFLKTVDGNFYSFIAEMIKIMIQWHPRRDENGV